MKSTFAQWIHLNVKPNIHALAWLHIRVIWMNVFALIRNHIGISSSQWSKTNHVLFTCSILFMPKAFSATGSPHRNWTCIESGIFYWTARLQGSWGYSRDSVISRVPGLITAVQMIPCFHGQWALCFDWAVNESPCSLSDDHTDKWCKLIHIHHGTESIRHLIVCAFCPPTTHSFFFLHFSLFSFLHIGPKSGHAGV